jgi:hypothetical protein
MKFKFSDLFVSSLLLAFLSVSLSVSSQDDIFVTKVKETMSQGEQPGYLVIIPQARLEVVKKEWARIISKEVKSKPIEIEHEIHLNGAIAEEISPDPINIYSLLTDVDSSIHLVAFYEIDSGFFFDPETYPDNLVSNKIFNGIQNYMRRFAAEQYIVAVEDELEIEEDKLKELNKELSGMKKEKEKMEKAIKEEEQNIIKADEEINILLNQKEQQLEVIEEKRISASLLIDKEVKKEAKAEVKILEKERKKADRNIEKLEKAKVTSKNKIKENEQDIDENMKDQEALVAKIEAQELVIEQVELKLKGIK